MASTLARAHARGLCCKRTGWDFEEKLFFWMSFVVTMAPEMQTQVLSERWTHLPTFLRLTICPRHPEKTRPKVVGNGPHHRAGIP